MLNQRAELIGKRIGELDVGPTARIGVVDLGSNSGRLVVYDQYGPGHLNIVEDARVPLRLANDLLENGSLGPGAMARTVDALREFHSIAQGAGAERLIVVGTSSMREATNGEEFLRNVQQTAGMDIHVIDGDSEARYSFLGAIHGLPVWHGFVLDIGGGSLELTRFQQRRDVASWTVPLGALRTTTEFVRSDPPTSKEIRNLKRHIADKLDELSISPAEVGDILVGTGGTVRNIAKINRKQRRSPIQRLHGYVLPFQRVRRIATSLASADAARRAATPGLNSDRADSIVGGAIAVQMVMELLGVSELLVSGKGLREGIAFALSNENVPDPDAVRRTSVAALARRFGSWEPERAEQRVAAFRQLAQVLDAGFPPEACSSAEFAAILLDIGRSVDYYDRLSHSATIVEVADLDGFTHREIAFMSAIIREADRGQTDFSPYAPLLTADDVESVARCGVMLLVADEIERRYPRNAILDLKIELSPDSLSISLPLYADYGVAKLSERFRRVFGRELVFN